MGALTALGPDLIVPCHCTGELAVEKLRQTFGERVQVGSAGATYMFDGTREPGRREET
jgi:7,8-dihydropterin-6-yl-methyl-4-(beta-D-ribofuranosyl)aminobenzene 5'-phosphate synthase